MNANKDEIHLSNRLEKMYSGILFDVVRAFGFRNCVLPSSLRPLNVDHKIAGRVFTVAGEVDQSQSEKESLLRWCEFLSKAPSDHIIVVQPNDETIAHLGELSAETLNYKGVRGFIADGGCRDTEFIYKQDFPVWCRYFTPLDLVGYWRPATFNEPIMIGSVTINAGDYIFADRDGVVAIPASIAEAVADRAEELINTENLVRKAILEGIDPVDAYLKYEKF
jgi:regulator of RNase E activity RraA